MSLRIRAIALMLASGFAGLGYQIVWTQQSALWLGHEAAAMLAIVAAFFGGLGLGAWALGRRIDASSRPARWYAACEVMIGFWGAVLVFLMTPASRALLHWMGPEPSAVWHWTVTFGGTFLLLLPATAAMGATLPAMERIVAAAQAHRLPVPLLYAANTFGAVLGVVGTAFVLVPWLGLSASAAICVVLNFLCALVAWRALATESAPAVTPARAGAHLLTLALTGFLGIGYEVLVVRVLGQVMENTVFTFAILLAVYLVGTALGAAGYARWALRHDVDLRDRLLRWQAVACLTGILALIVAEPAKQAMLEVLGPGVGSALLVETLLASAAFLLPTVLMGALFSHLVTQARAAGASFGTALGVNTLAAAFAPLLFGVMLLPRLGVSPTLLVVSAGYLLIVTSWRSAWQAGVAVAVAALFAWHPPLGRVTLPDGGRLISHAEGVSANVSVIEDSAGVATLHINNRQQEGSSATEYSDARQALVPLLMQAAPERVLFLGLGTGATARSAVLDDRMHVDVVELLPEVITASALFARLQKSPAQSTLHFITADARRFVRTATARYDVIIADNFHPARSGSAALYTREHFAAVRAALDADGLFCQWLPLHQLDLATTRAIVATYLTEFPHAWAVLATNSLDTPVLGLIGRRDEARLDMAAIRSTLAARAVPAAAVDLGDDLALLGNLVAGPESLARFSAGAPINTDDHPVVAYLAPRITYDPESTPRSRLLALSGELAIRPEEVIDAAREGEWARRLAAFWRARDQYLVVGSQVRPSGDVRDMLAQVRAPLLGVLEISPDFRPAYDPLVRMARALATVDPPQARGLLDALAARNPDWPEARLALAELAQALP